MASGVLVGRGYVSIRPEFEGDWTRQITRRSGAAGSSAAGAFADGFGKAFGQLAKTAAIPVAAVGVSVGAALSSSFAAAGAGAGAFTAAVKPQLAKVTEASELYTKAQEAAKKGGKEAAAAQKEYAAALKEMTPATRTTAKAFIGLKSDFASWSDSLSATTMPIFTRGINILRDALPQLTPFVKAGALAIRQFMDNLGGGGASAVFSKFRGNLQAIATGSLRSFLNIAKNVAVGFVGILNAFMPMSQGLTTGLEGLSKRFAAFGAGLSTSSGFAQFMAYVRANAPLVLGTLKDLAVTAVNLITALAPLGGVTLKVINVFASLIAAIPTPVLRVLANIFAVVAVGMKVYTLAMAAYTAATLVATTVSTAFRAVMFALRVLWLTNPITLVVVGIIALGVALYAAYQRVGWFRAAVQAAWTGIKIAAMFLWNSVLKPMFAGFMVGLRAIGTAASWLWSILGPIFRFIWTAAKVLLTIVVVAVILPIIVAFKLLAAAGKWLWTNAIGPAFRGIAKVAVWLYRNVIAPQFALLRAAFRLVGTIAKWLYNNAIKPAMGWIAARVRWVVNAVKAAWAVLRAAITVLGNHFKRLYNAYVKPVMGWIGSKIKAVWNATIRPAFNAVKAAVRLVGIGFEKAKNAIAKAWGKISSIAKKPIAFIINTVYNKGIVPVWNKVAKAFGAPTLKKAPGFAEGGYTGPGGTYQPAGIVHAGEYVIPKAETAKIGLPALNHMRSTGQLPGYAKGGIVGDAWGWVKNAASTGWDKVKEGAKWLKDTIKGSATAGLNALVKPLINQIPGAGKFGDMAKKIPKKALSSIFDWSGKADKKLEAAGVIIGGGGFKTGQRWAKTQHGKRYQWGGNGNPSWDCLTLSSVITTPEGYKALRDIRPGDLVLAYKDGKLVSSRVLAKWNTGTQDLFKVRTRNRSLRATAGHRVLVAAPVERPMADPDERVALAEWGTTWKHVRDLTTSDYLVTYTGSRKESGEEVPTELAWLMGLWVADGSVHQNGGIRICVYDDLAEKAMSVLRKHTPDRQVTHHPRHGVMVSDVRRARWMIRNGFSGKSHERTVPAAVMGWSHEAQLAFLNGYADGDGSYKGGGDFETAELITYKATSRELIDGIRELHLRQGDRVTCTRTEQRNKDIYIAGKKVKNARPIHNIDVARGKGASQTTGAGHRPGLLRLVEQLKLEHMSVQKVLCVEPDGAEETWDIEVEDSHSFVSDGLVSHNCSGFMSAIESVIRGQKPHRRWATGSFPPGTPGWRRNARSPFQIGITNAGVGHTAGTINGTNVESSGSGVRYGHGARGASNRMFSSRWGFTGKKYDGGGWLPPGVTTAVNATGQPEAILTAQQWRTMQGAATGGDGASASSELVGDLYLDSGEFLGKVRGVVRQEHAAVLTALNARPRR